MPYLDRLPKPNLAINDPIGFGGENSQNISAIVAEHMGTIRDLLVKIPWYHPSRPVGIDRAQQTQQRRRDKNNPQAGYLPSGVMIHIEEESAADSDFNFLSLKINYIQPTEKTVTLVEKGRFNPSSFGYSGESKNSSAALKGILDVERQLKEGLIESPDSILARGFIEGVLNMLNGRDNKFGPQLQTALDKNQSPFHYKYTDRAALENPSIFMDFQLDAGLVVGLSVRHRKSLSPQQTIEAHVVTKTHSPRFYYIEGDNKIFGDDAMKKADEFLKQLTSK